MENLKKSQVRQQQSCQFNLNHLRFLVQLEIPIIMKRTSYIVENTHIHNDDENIPKGFFTTIEENFIPLRWEQLYHYIKFGKAPAEQRQAFENDDEIGTAGTEAAAHLQPLAGK